MTAGGVLGIEAPRRSLPAPHALLDTCTLSFVTTTTRDAGSIASAARAPAIRRR